MTLLRSLRFRMAARLLGDQWYVPAPKTDKAFIVLASEHMLSVFPVKTLRLKRHLTVPRLGSSERPTRSGRFAGTLE